ncbi:hypothetical protein AVDCRST_MAG81-3422 [uncultured Synechococcales cyanobacterium]|uniref:Uncharacterized protein n=1 Tax=uncultured Synechococcales cyanobacterium TaxID=1936017 RepID=A0A6J4VMX7_9CYAN|nr:hypothetical protein AVDCRST_MAG81-3422 [uncultured Synechococcales cyanobacterium]
MQKTSQSTVLSQDVYATMTTYLIITLFTSSKLTRSGNQ